MLLLEIDLRRREVEDGGCKEGSISSQRKLNDKRELPRKIFFQFIRKTSAAEIRHQDLNVVHRNDPIMA